MRSVAGFVGQRLTQAREAKGLTKKALSDSVEISTTALTDLESGKYGPKQDTFDRLVSVLAFPPEFFFRPLFDAKMGPVYWRRQASEVQRSQDKTQQRIIWAAEAFSTLSEHVNFNSVELPDVSWLPANWAHVTSDQIETLAERCRSDWGLGLYPIPDAVLALENIGVPVLAFDIENEKQYGYSAWASAINRPIVGVNTLECSWARQRYNLFHEFAHVLLHVRQCSSSDLRNPATYKEMEAQAHRFAAALLFPRKAFLRQVRYASLEEFAAHKQEFGISILAQVMRAEQLGIARPEWAKALIVQASKKGYRRPFGEPFDKVKPLERPRMFKRAVEVIEKGSELLLARVRAALPFPRVEQLALFGRTLEPSGHNVIQLRDFSPS